VTPESTATSLIQLAQAKDFDGVRARFRDHPPDEVLAAADVLREDDIYNVAIELYDWLLEQAPSAAVHFGIGQCYGKIYEYDQALSHLDKAFAEDPGRSEGASYYAYILERHERMEDADRWYRQALDGAEADDLWARSHYAWFLEKWGKTDDAKRTYDDVLERNPAYTWASKRYASLLDRLGEPDRAKALLRRSVEQSPGNRFAQLNYLEYLLLTDDPDYSAYRESLDTSDGPAWYPVMVDLFDIYRDDLLSGDPDRERIGAWEAEAEKLKDSVHRDFDDLTAKLEQSGGDVAEWRRLVQALLK
jgi:tetratricopeptide (TPR) repeat protein